MMNDQINMTKEHRRCKPVDPLVRDALTVNDKVRADLEAALRESLVRLGSEATARIARPFIETKPFNGMMNR